MSFSGFSKRQLQISGGSLARIILFVLLSTVLVGGFAGCAYTLRNYATIGESLEHDTWSLRCFFGTKESGDSLTFVYYYINFSESDTTKHARLRFTVDSAMVTYSGLGEPILLEREKWGSAGGLHVGATNVNHGIDFGPCDVPKPSPDTIIIDQDITIFYRDTGEILTHFHHQTRAKLEASRHWRFLEFMAGT